MDILFSDLKKKDVYDAATGKKLGRIADLKFSFPAGKMLSVTVGGGLFGLGETKTMPFADVEKIGEDAVFIRTERKGGKPVPCPPEKRNPIADPCPPKPPFPPVPPCGSDICPPKPPFPPVPPCAPPRGDDNCLPPHMSKGEDMERLSADLRLDLSDYE